MPNVIIIIIILFDDFSFLFFDFYFTEIFYENFNNLSHWYDDWLITDSDWIHAYRRPRITPSYRHAIDTTADHSFSFSSRRRYAFTTDALRRRTIMRHAARHARRAFCDVMPRRARRAMQYMAYHYAALRHYWMRCCRLQARAAAQPPLEPPVRENDISALLPMVCVPRRYCRSHAGRRAWVQIIQRKMDYWPL